MIHPMATRTNASLDFVGSFKTLLAKIGVTVSALMPITFNFLLRIILHKIDTANMTCFFGLFNIHF